jgi:hypothetical protein
MRVISFHVDQNILSDGTYQLNEEIVYTSPRYGKTITVPAGRISDGATGAMDITSRGWWIHDELCSRGKWDDGTLLSNWQCSQVLQDVLAEEGRYWQGKRWFYATFLLGGGQARKNGMFSVAAVVLMLALTGCASNKTTIHACHSLVIVVNKVDKPLSVDALDGNNVSPSGNTVPLSGL